MTKRCWWHTWVDIGTEEVTYPKLGPFDPRTEAQRTYNREMKVCAKCGRKEEHSYDPY